MFKSIKISDSTHVVLKNFCQKNNLKLNAWVESLILEKLEKTGWKHTHESAQNVKKK